MTDFDEYIRQTEPDKKEKAHIWQTAIGLQQVDGLKPSAYLIETAKQNIEGDITFDEVKNRIDAYYKTQTNRQVDADDRTEEADKVSARIAEILSEKTFSFSPVAYLNIHRRLFSGIYKFAGKIRDYNITKSEWVLDGEIVLYADADNLRETLEYDFEQEKNFDYKGLSQQQIIEHIAHFIAYLWQIHIFGEGNTRTTAVFLIKYLRKLGFDDISNDLFAQHSWYFRNAFVRANYKNLKNNVYATNKYLEQFLENLLLGENNILKNRELHINFVPSENVPVNDTVKQENVSVNVPVKINTNITEKIVLDLLKINPTITYEQIAEKINKNRKTVQRTIASLKEKGIISRVGSDKTGSWKIIATIIR
ncbi:MAG: Fic family protein [Dysgonamonadaceae bacterium]|jgi:fido (protein-threonine AMPylation protein)/DNA-binding CsgD family transcriptional regulator|nr:Fic family protein [Dysgonamonadaceae bacterium]